MVITGKTKSGFAYKIQKEQIEDYDFVELVGNADENPALFPKIMNILLGDEEVNKLKEHLRTEEGFVPIQKMVEEFQDIMDNPKLKNS